MAINPTSGRTPIQFHPLLSVMLSLAIYAGLIYIPALDQTYQIPRQHLYIVSLASLIAALLAFGMGMSAIRLRNHQLLFISMAFISLTTIFGLHGLTTPGVLYPMNPMVGVAAQLSFMLTALWLFLSALPSDNAVAAAISRRERWLLPIWIALLAAFLFFALRDPGIGAAIPVNQKPLQYGAAVLTIGLALFATRRYWLSFRYARFPLQSAITHSSALLAVSQVILTTATLWHISWWWYHVLLLVVVILPMIGMVQQYNRGQSLGLAVSGLFASDPQDFLEAGISPSVRALIAAVEARDPYTAGHTRRVAVSALRLGQKMQLPPEEMRALAQGALLHDIGKLETPDTILNFPGRLDADQMQAIRAHPIKGYELCRRLGFMREELSVIRHHHEHYDGSGYPDGLAGEQIPILARLLAVVDVYDALTSDRAYRPAWSHQDALRHLQKHGGTLFDPAIVETWVEIQRFER